MRRKTVDSRIGEWSWNHQLFSQKYEVNQESGCWEWKGAHHRAGGLFGAYKNDAPQMTQARRIAYMYQHNTPVNGKFLYSTCNNLQCVNPAHHYIHTPPSH